MEVPEPRIIDIIRTAKQNRGSCISDVLTGPELNALDQYLQAQGQYLARFDVVGTALYRAWWMPFASVKP